MEFKPGQILNFTWGGVFGNLIQIYNQREYNEKGPTHTGIISEVKEGSVIVYEANRTGFNKLEYGKGELQGYIYTKNLVVGESIIHLKNVKENCEKYEKTPYGIFDIVYIGLYTFIGKSAFKLSTDAKKIICSEAVVRVLYDSSDGKIDFEKEYNKPFSFVAPIDLKFSKQIRWLKN
jgi:hypothetical protein